jgi:glycosyltransferase
MDALARQSCKDHEHVVVDGLSKDRTLEVVRRKATEKTQVISEKDHGIYDALNKGIAHAQGDVIGFLHADDFYPDSQVLERVAHTFEDPQVDCCYGDHEYVRAEDSSRVVRYWRAGAYYPGIFLKGWMPPHTGFYARRSVYEKLGGFDTRLRIAADYEFMLRALHLHQHSVVYLPHVLTRMRVGGASNRSLKNILQKSREDLLAWKLNGLRGGYRAVALKNLSKLPQFFVRRGKG